MMKPKTIKLNHDERIVAVVPESCGGPGWSNSPTWVYIIGKSGTTIRTECIQPEERSQELHALFAAGSAMCSALIDAVPVKEIKKPKGEMK